MLTNRHFSQLITKNIIAPVITPCNLLADQTNSATNRRAPMEYLVTFIAPIVHQRSAHQCFVLSRVGSNANIVRL